jgi:hypothetical protein
LKNVSKKEVHRIESVYRTFSIKHIEIETYRVGKENSRPKEVTTKKTLKFLVCSDRNSYDKEANWENEPSE